MRLTFGSELSYPSPTHMFSKERKDEGKCSLTKLKKKKIDKLQTKRASQRGEDLSGTVNLKPPKTKQKEGEGHFFRGGRVEESQPTLQGASWLGLLLGSPS